MKLNNKTIKERLKENWNKKDEVCPTCGKVMKERKGLTKQNLMKFFRKPTSQDWLLFIIIVLVILGGYAYSIEVEQYKEIIKNPAELCQVYYSGILYGNFGDSLINKSQDLNSIFNDFQTHNIT